MGDLQQFQLGQAEWGGSMLLCSPAGKARLLGFPPWPPGQQVGPRGQGRAYGEIISCLLLGWARFVGSAPMGSKLGLLPTVAKQAQCLPLSLPGQNLASGPGRSRSLGAWELPPSHRPAAWGGLPVSTEFNPVHSTHISGASSMCQF